MRSAFLALSVLLGAGLVLAQDDPKPKSETPQQPKVEKVAIGAEVPKDLTLTDTAGNQVSFGSLRGKVVMVHFWSTTCPWEKVAEPKLQAIADDYKDKNVVVLAINSNTGEIGEQPKAEQWKAEKDEDRPYAQLRAHAKKVKVNHPILIDHGGVAARTFDGRTTPHCFVIDPKGVLRYSGALDSDGKKAEGADPYVRQAIDAVLAGKDIETTYRQPYG